MKIQRITLVRSLMIVLILSLPCLLYFFNDTLGYPFAIETGRAAVVYFLFSFLLYVFLLAIRCLPKNRFKLNLVLFTRLFIRFHIAFAAFGTTFILVHGVMMLFLSPLTMNSSFISGLLTVLGLILVLISGYFRQVKSSGRRKKGHRYLSFLFMFILVIHIYF